MLSAERARYGVRPAIIDLTASRLGSVIAALLALSTTTYDLWTCGSTNLVSRLQSEPSPRDVCLSHQFEATTLATTAPENNLSGDCKNLKVSAK
jgi:hypothetical protein